MPIIHAVNGIVEMHPVLPVSPRLPAAQVMEAGRDDRSKGQERQTADHATRLAQQAYQQQVQQDMPYCSIPYCQGELMQIS